MNLVKYISNQCANPNGFGGIISTLTMNIINQTQYNYIIKMAQKIYPKSILDIGYGNGYLLKKMSKRLDNTKFYGIDISKDMLKIATNKNKKAIQNRQMFLSIGDVMNTNFKDNSFDFIDTTNTVYFWDNIENAYIEIKRILKNNGIFINLFYSDKWLNKIQYTKYNFNKYSPDYIKNIINQLGFSKVELVKLKEETYCLIVKK